jgi:hypothetical protein
VASGDLRISHLGIAFLAVGSGWEEPGALSPELEKCLSREESVELSNHQAQALALEQYVVLALHVVSSVSPNPCNSDIV